MDLQGGISSDGLELQMRLDALFRALSRAGVTVSAAEQAEAFAIARQSSDAPQEVLMRRLLATVLKDPEPKARQVFETVFRRVFAASHLQGGDALAPAPARPAGERRYAPIRSETTRLDPAGAPPWTLAAVILALVLGLFAYLVIGDSQPVEVEPETPPKQLVEPVDPDEDLLGPGPSTGPGPSGVDPTRELARIALVILGASGPEAELNLARLAEAFAPDLPLGLSRARFQHKLVQRSTADPELVFRVNEHALPRLTLAVYYLLGNRDQPAEEDLRFLRDAGEAVRLRVSNAGAADRTAEFPGFRDAYLEFLLALAEARPDVHAAPGAGGLAVDFATLVAQMSDLREMIFVSEEPPFRLTDYALGIVDRIQALPGDPYAPIAAPPVRGMQARWEVFLLAVLLPVALALWRMATLRRRLAVWFTANPPPLNFRPRYDLWGGLSQALDEVTGRDMRLRAARELSRPTLRDTGRLDPGRTIQATARNLGRFEPVYRKARVTPSYLFIILRQSAEDHQAQHLRELVGSLSHLGASIEIWYMDHDGNALYRERRGRTDLRGRDEERFAESYLAPRIPLRNLRKRLPDRRAVVLGWGDVFLTPGTGAPRPWVRELRRWPFFALLTPQPAARWGRREALLAQIFDQRLYEATPEGLRDLAGNTGQMRSAEIRPEGRTRRYMWEVTPSLLTSPTRPEAELLARLETELTEALGEGGMLWLRAATVYPAFHWDLTIYLGKMLSDPGEGGGTLFSAERLRVLSALPWFARARFPLWAVRWLQDQMRPDERLAVRDLLLGRLPDARRQPDSALNPAVFVTEGTGPAAHHVDPGHARVFLELLSERHPEGRIMKANEDIARLYRASRRRFWQRESMLLVVLVCYAVTAAFVAPWPWSTSALMAGDYLPLLVLGLCAPVAYLLLDGTIHHVPFRRRGGEA